MKFIFSLICLAKNKRLNKQGPLDKQQRREAGSFVDQDQQYFLIKRKTKCKLKG